MINVSGQSVWIRCKICNQMSKNDEYIKMYTCYGISACTTTHSAAQPTPPTPANVSTRGSICHCHCSIPPDSSDAPLPKKKPVLLECINGIHQFYYKNLYAYIYIYMEGESMFTLC